MTINLKFNANVLCAAEKYAGEKIVEILEDMDSEAGISLTSLRALVAAGRAGAAYPSTFPIAFLDEHAAGILIDSHGTAETAVAVGQALRDYVQRGAA